MNNIEQIYQRIHDYQQPMLRFTLLHVAHPQDAEDIMQETMLACFASHHQFLGNADFKTYLFGILKNKIADYLREKYRNRNVESLDFYDEIDEVWFDQHQHWRATERPDAWGAPEKQLASKQFFVILDICIKQLPRTTAGVFTMKELLDFTSEEVCANFNLSRENFWKIMSRARKQIQACQNIQWFGDK